MLGTLYAYTPEVLPSAHRGTGNGIAIGWNRVMGILSAVIATVADVGCDGLTVDEILLMCARLRRLFRYSSALGCISLWRLLRLCSRSNRMEGGVREGHNRDTGWSKWDADGRSRAIGLCWRLWTLQLVSYTGVRACKLHDRLTLLATR